MLQDMFNGRCLPGLFWAWSALVNLPVIGSSYGAIANLDPFNAALKRIARLNVTAAGCAFVSAFAQAIALYLSLHDRIVPN
jgi:hypothetical protein